MVKEKKQNKRLRVILTEISSIVFVIFVLFLIKQILIILNWKNEVYRVYSIIYYWIIITVPILFCAYIIVDIFHPFIRIRGKITSTIKKWKIGFIIINTIIGALAGLMLITTIVALIITPTVSSKPLKITFLYDTGSMSRFMVQEFATPVLVELGIDKKELAILPLSNNSFVESVKEATYLIVLSHGEEGKVYSTKPLNEYEYSLFEGIQKENLKLVYFSACYLGINGYKEKWKQAMMPARTILYDRESAVLEHIIWIVFNAKSSITRVE